jgi:protein phosphatase
MGTTVSAVVVHGSCAYIGQVGDSRVYLKRADRKMHQLTDDHSLVAEQVRNGYISEQEARHHSLKNLITRAVGIKDTVECDLFSLRLQENDLILICSDGLSNMLDDNQISSVLASESVQGAVRVLVGKALAKGGNDNITAILLRVAKEPPHRELQEGADELSVPVPGLFNRLKSILKNGR